jgi:hypothetical protein
MKKGLVICLLLCLGGLIVVGAWFYQKNTAHNSQTASAHQTASSNQDVFGQVMGVSGNDITIALAQMPQRNQNQGGQRQQNQTAKPPSSTSQGQVQRGQLTLKLTGENKTVTIPDGAKIYSGGSPGGQNQGQGQGSKEITLNDIKNGDTISVYYTAGTTTVDHVLVRSGGQ